MDSHASDTSPGGSADPVRPDVTTGDGDGAVGVDARVEGGPVPSERTSMKLGEELPVGLDQLVDFMFRPNVLCKWLDASAVLPPKAGSKFLLPARAGAKRSGRVELTRSESQFELVLRFGPASASTTLRIVPRGTGACMFRVAETGLSGDAEVKASLTEWQSAISRLAGLVADAVSGRDLAKQAVVVVHGIGEQLPGQTLRSFVDAVLPSTRAFVKPDRSSKLFEMRKITVEGSRRENFPTTDVYELYWAHLIRDTTFGQVMAWMIGLLLTRQSRIPKGLGLHIWALRIVLVLAVIALALPISGWLEASPPAIIVAILGVLTTAGGFAWALVKKVAFVDFAGDAARYLRPHPDNIARRQEIREAGVDLIESLHDSGQYDRIVLFGHSLGSVIAYDILAFAWIRFGNRMRSPSNTDSSRVLAVEAALQRELARRAKQPDDAARADPGILPAQALSVERAQDLQHEAWLEYRRNGFSWLITDFITAGSPLTHASLLLPLDKSTTFETLKQQRVFPTCPPTDEEVADANGVPARRFTFERRYRQDATGDRRSVTVPHHAAPFALTRWTNLYFPFSGILRGDPVGGELRGVFGEWVDDRPLEHPGGGFLGFAHTKYWTRGRSSKHIDTLQDALRLHTNRELIDLAASLPLVLQEPGPSR